MMVTTIVDAFIDVYMEFLLFFEEGGMGEPDQVLDYFVGLLFGADDWMELTIMTVGNQWFWLQNDQKKRSLIRAFVMDVLEHEELADYGCAVAA